ncbi:hypothetical protein IE983_24970 [Enterobacter hormaechei]|uniref:Uncharacterized protein n=1 Tax=Enterobacter hormaechei TaxID=158836 RepID=A0A927DNA7_9ENTR|nr:hypothetical protein [Enterobacter hormaechei]
MTAQAWLTWWHSGYWRAAHDSWRHDALVCPVAFATATADAPARRDNRTAMGHRPRAAASAAAAAADNRLAG